MKYEQATKGDLDAIRIEACESIIPMSDSRIAVTYQIKRSHARALWNEIERLREHCYAVDKTREQESAAYRSTIADNAATIETLREEITHLRTYNPNDENVKLRDEIIALTAMLTSAVQLRDDAQHQFTTSQGNLRAAHADVAALRAEIDQQWRPMVALGKTTADAQAAALEKLERERDAAREAIERTHYPETKESVEARLTKTLHDRYTMAALTGLIARDDSKNLTYMQRIRAAREMADEAMKQRGDQNAC